MSLVLQKFVPRLLTPEWVKEVRTRGTLNQAERLSMCRACNRPILIGEMRVTGRAGYLNAHTVHVHQKCGAQ